RAEDSLRNVTTTTGFRSGIPEGPPLQADVYQKSQDGQHPQCFCGHWAREIRKERSWVACTWSRGSHLTQLCQERVHAACGRDRIARHADHDRHLERELKQVGTQDAP